MHTLCRLLLTRLFLVRLKDRARDQAPSEERLGKRMLREAAFAVVKRSRNHRLLTSSNHSSCHVADTRAPLTKDARWLRHGRARCLEVIKNIGERDIEVPRAIKSRQGSNAHLEKDGPWKIVHFSFFSFFPRGDITFEEDRLRDWTKNLNEFRKSISTAWKVNGAAPARPLVTQSCADAGSVVSCTKRNCYYFHRNPEVWMRTTKTKVIQTGVEEKNYTGHMITVFVFHEDYTFYILHLLSLSNLWL